MGQLLRAAQSWASSDQIIGQKPDRQVLVVGDTIVGHTLTLLLHQAGFDPLLVTATDRAYESEIAYLWAAATRTLEFIGVDLPGRCCSTAVESVSVRNTVECTEGATTCRAELGDREPPLVVPTREIHGVLEEQSAGRSRRIDRRIEARIPRDDSIVIEFSDGVREWFDLVLYADAPMITPNTRGDETVDTTSLSQYEISISDEKLSWEAHQSVDIWSPDVHGQAIPRQSASGLVRLTAPEAMRTDAIVGPIAEQLLIGDTALLDTKLSETTASTVRQTPLENMHIDSDWWANGRVGRCGQAACATVPASGFGLSFGIEDALAVVTELARNDQSVTGVLATYADQRAKRLRTLVRTASLAQSESPSRRLIPSDPPLETVGLLRTVSLAPLCNDERHSVQRL